MHRKLLQQVKDVRRLVGITLLLSILGTVATMAQMTFLSHVVQQVFLGHAVLVGVQSTLTWLLIAIVGRSVCIWSCEMSAQRAAIHVKSRLRERLFNHILCLGPAYSKNEHTGELVATANEGIERLDPYVSRYIPQMVLSGLVPLIIGGYVFFLDWSSGVILFVTAPVISLLMVLVGSYAEKHIERQWAGLSRMSAHFLDAVQGLTTLKLFGRSKTESERVARISERYRERTMKVLRVAFLSGMVLEFLVSAAIGLIAVTLGVRLLNGGIIFEQAFLILLLAPEFYRPLRELGIQRHAGMEGGVAAKRIFEILETPLPINSMLGESGRLVAPLSIVFNDLTYCYPDQERAVLKEINLTLTARTCTALIGRSGAGKSTLINLLLRFMDTGSGQIMVNGIPLNELAVETWREYVALVPQRPYLFYGSVRANIGMARPDASEDEIEQAAELAGAAIFIHQLPQGYDTHIGERGARLSAGQVQRIAIARAFLKDAPLLILDEPTSSLDIESELVIRKALVELIRNRTVLVIAHRQNTIAEVDQIAVLEAGRLIEVGSQAELLCKEGGAYVRLSGLHRKIGIATR